jgi:uncharacterized membrane protein
MRQIPMILASVVTGAIVIYYLGFWLGVIVNGIAWGTAVFLARLSFVRNIDRVRDDRYLMYFVLALIGRNK